MSQGAISYLQGTGCGIFFTQLKGYINWLPTHIRGLVYALLTKMLMCLGLVAIELVRDHHLSYAVFQRK